MSTFVPSLFREQCRSFWSRPTLSWMLYDLANTMFSFAILSLYFPRWVIQEGGSDALLGDALALSMALLLVSAPILGALSDHASRRMPFLVVTTLCCVVATMLLGTGNLVQSLMLFGIANFFFQSGLIFYDALLPQVSTADNRGLISGLGVAFGYVGSFIMLGVSTFLLSRGASWIDLFRVTGLLFLLFAIPCFLFVREQPRPDARPFGRQAVADSFRAVWHTAGRLREYPGLGRFLLGRVFYTDVINTLISFMPLYASAELGFREGEVNVVVAISIIAAVVGGILWGRILDGLGPKRVLNIVLLLLMASILLGVLIPLLALPRWLFYLVGILAGVTLSGAWSSDRLLMLRLSPPRYLGQFYGLYAMVGRFGHLLGPFLWGMVATRLGLGRSAALLSLIFLTLVAIAILRPVREPSREWQPEELLAA